MVTLIDNQSLCDYFDNNSINSQPNQSNLNELIAKTQIALYNPLMYSCGGKRVFMQDYENSLVPYPACKYCSPSFYDLETMREYEERKETELAYVEEKITHSVVNATQYCASLPFKMYATQHPSYRQLPLKMIGLQANFAGRAISPFETLKSLQILKARPSYLKFLDYIPSGIKSVLVSEASEKSVAMLHHSTNIGAILFSTVLEPFRKMYAKRAFVHWFVGEGPDSGIFGSVDNACASILQSYSELEVENQSFDEEEGGQE